MGETTKTEGKTLTVLLYKDPGRTTAPCDVAHLLEHGYDCAAMSEKQAIEDLTEEVKFLLRRKRNGNLELYDLAPASRDVLATAEEAYVEDEAGRLDQMREALRDAGVDAGLQLLRARKTLSVPRTGTVVDALFFDQPEPG